MDELLGDFWDRAGTGAPPASGFVAPRRRLLLRRGPPERAIVKVELPGVELDAVNIEVRGRELVISGERPVRETEGRTYQQVELPSGPFRRVVELSVDVDAERARPPMRTGSSGSSCRLRLPQAARRVPIDSDRAADRPAGAGLDGRRRDRPSWRWSRSRTSRRRPRRSEPLPDALPVLPLRETVTFPDTLTPLAVGQERSIKLVNDVLSGNRMLAMVASKDPENDEPGPDDLYDVGVVGTVARMMKVPDGTLRILVQGAERVRVGPYVAEEPYLVARIEASPRRGRALARARGAHPQRPEHLHARSSSRSPTCPRSSSSRSPTSTSPRRSPT